ncbi:MAG: hypothetical protein OHK0046_18510 [Anaerolineae bacterium]
MTLLSNVKVVIQGPFWTANAVIVRGPVPSGSASDLAVHARTLFVDRQARTAYNQNNFFVPGMLVALCFVTDVEINTGSPNPQTYLWKRAAGATPPDDSTVDHLIDALYTQNGQLSLLLLTKDPDINTGNEARVFTCVGGEINLGVLNAENNALKRLYDALTLTPITGEAASVRRAVEVHASGVSIYGAVKLPWWPERTAAPFLLTRHYDGRASQPFLSEYRLTVEIERLTLDETKALSTAWWALSRSLNPRNPVAYNAAEPETPTWVTLELVNPLGVPRMVWKINPWQAAPTALPLFFAPGQVNLLLSDQQPYNATHRPTSLAQVVAEVGITGSETTGLELTLVAGEADPGQVLLYGWERVEGVRDERLAVSGVQVAFSATETPRTLRSTLGLPIPEWVLTETPEPIHPAVVWAFMPLEDGWAQLPIPNLTDQIYLDAGLSPYQEPADVPDAAEAAARRTPVLQGTFALGNDDAGVLAAHPDEQPWNMTLLDAGYVVGRWVLLPLAEGEFVLERVQVELRQPEMILNGLLWLSTGRPAPEDALPNMDDWLTGLAAPPLRVVQPGRDLFPPALLLNVQAFSVALRAPAALTPEVRQSAVLTAWSFHVEANAPVMDAMVQARVLPSDVFSEYPPLVWQRHPYLPMIQALPLTQSKTPANYPGTSRQLIPFALPLQPTMFYDAPLNWHFGVVSGGGAAQWPRLLGAALPAPEWRTRSDLPLVSLSLPGLVLDAHMPGITGEHTHDLAVQWRFDLPYTDQMNALAQLPKVTQNPEDVSPLPDSPIPEPPQPLTRETFNAHWETLETRANLAAADAVDALHITDTGETHITGLVEPFIWPVQVSTVLDAYPGQLILQEPGAGESLTLEAESALRGLTGTFTLHDDQLQRMTNGGTGFEIEAGSMAAYRANGNGSGLMRDQRGLWRGASHEDGAWVFTPLVLHSLNPNEGTLRESRVLLTTCLTALTLHVRAGTEGAAAQAWRFWCCDLPVMVDDQAFTLARTHSVRVEDVNDPDATARDVNHLNGYEWRLGPAAADGDALESALSNGYLPLYGLHFYPLRLEKAVFDVVDAETVRALTQVDIVGRLQLPLPNPQELPDLSNAVRLTFAAGEDGTLMLTAVEQVSAQGVWPLALLGGELSRAPQVTWGSVALNAARDLVFAEAQLQFFLFDAAWTLDLEALVFAPAGEGGAPGGGALSQIIHLDGDENTPLHPDNVSLTFDLATYVHSAHLELWVQLGDRLMEAGASTIDPLRTAFSAFLMFDLMATVPETAITWETGWLFDDIAIAALNRTVRYTERALQFNWQHYTPQPDVDLQLLPGMHLPPVNGEQGNMPGFAVLAFAVQAGVVPKLALTAAFVETLVTAQWGDFLQDIHRGEAETQAPERVFSSSAGDVVFNYTARWRGADDPGTNAWDETYLLNGMIEVKSLLSWPTVLLEDTGDSVVLPAVTRGSAESLRHTRHTIRLLLNQHEIPAGALVAGDQTLIFNVVADHPWQFLTVVEHQLVDVLPGAAFDTPEAAVTVRDDRRWTALQEVRFIPRQAFVDFLTEFNTHKPLVEKNIYNAGYLGDALRARLIAEANKLQKPTLIVEASAPHWVRQQSLETNDGTSVSGGATALQFLPGGVQLGILSTPGDYPPSAPDDPQWLLLTLPFLGRLQPQAQDTADDSAESVLCVDPVLALHRQKVRGAALSEVAVAFAHWSGSAQPFVVKFSAFDSRVGRLWSRLDATMLEENWFRLQHPLREPQPQGLRSVMAALPDNPARLSRSVALRRAFDSFRRVYPPALLDETTENGSDNVPEADPIQIVWRQDALLAMQVVTDDDPAKAPLYAWPVLMWTLRDTPLAQPNKPTERLRRYASVTVMPVVDDQQGKPNRFPLCFSISPYLGLEYDPAPEADVFVRLVSAELLCLRGAVLRLVASYLYDVGMMEADVTLEDAVARNRAAYDLVLSAAQNWALETHRRLTPESPVAVLRFRLIEETGGMLTTDYRFDVVDEIAVRPRLAKRVFRVRSEVTELTFRQGQYGGAAMPSEVAAFEIAPPQTTGVQPLYLTPEKDAAAAAWPWGMSALRFSVQMTEGKTGVVGALPTEAGDVPALWWQAPQHSVQYRTASNAARPAAGLPKKFRAPAIKSLLPTLPALPMPRLEVKALLGSDAPPDEQGVRRRTWQSVLPGAIRYLVLGARAGAMFAFRHQLLRQHVNGTAANGMLVSGSVPVQHRVPRPVPLPPNTRPETALRPWASAFTPEENLLLTQSPADEAYFAASLIEGAADKPRRLQMVLAEPARGVITPGWDGSLVFVLAAHDDADGVVRLDSWALEISLRSAAGILAYVTPEDPLPLFTLELESYAGDLNPGTVSEGLVAAFAENGLTLPTEAVVALPSGEETPSDEVTVRYILLGEALLYRLEHAGGDTLIRVFARKDRFRFVPRTPETLSLLTGAGEIEVVALVQPADATDGYKQALVFPLRSSDPTALPLPLEPYFAHFEDPEYNRALASASGHVTRAVKVLRETLGADPKREEVLLPVKLSSDRKVYNPDSEIALRYDWELAWPTAWEQTAAYAQNNQLDLRRIDSKGTVFDLLTVTPLNRSLRPGKLWQTSLAALQRALPAENRLRPGDKLQVMLTIQQAAPFLSPANDRRTTFAKTEIVLTLDIVELPVIPVPQAGYAMLHRQIVESRQEVECARFAWMPEPSRVELINADDLRTEVVRRRAVFHWFHAARALRESRYAIQKIALNGSTHFPGVGEWIAPEAEAQAAVVALTLIDFDTQADLLRLENGVTVDLDALSTQRLNVRADVQGGGAPVGSVSFALDNTPNFYTENTPPYLFSTQPWTPTPGIHTLVARPYSLPNQQGQAGLALARTFTVKAEDDVDVPPLYEAEVVAVTLMNADTNQGILSLLNGAVLNLATLPTRNLNILVEMQPQTVGSVRFSLNDKVNFNIENHAPYSLAQNRRGDFLPWRPAAGAYVMIVTPFSQRNAKGTPGKPLTLRFTVIDEG